MRLPPVRVPRIRKPPQVGLTYQRPTLDDGGEAELLSGTVQDMTASAIEERFARALDKKRKAYQFRYVVGAPRGLPGFKEIDFILENNGQVYAVEIDSLFTHRRKREADRLHDAIVLTELEQEGLQVYPQVIHVLGDTELVDQQQADATVNKLFG